ncbi:MAG: hypothetical protein ABI867_24185 [Kofleriaceae bacterium]
MRSVLWILVALAVACGGNPRRDDALARAKAARAKGDYVGEAIALRDACNAATDDKKLCKQADQAWLAAQQASQASARTVCADIAPTLAAVDACLAAVGQIRKLSADDPEAARFAEAASRQHLARCFADSPGWQTSIEAALDLVRCQDARAAQIAIPVYIQQIQATRVDAREQVLRIADHPSYTDKLGAKSELLAAAACLSPIPDLVERARSTRAAFVDRARASIDLRASTSAPLPDLCTTAAAALGGRAVCGSPRAGAPQLTIGGEITLAPVEHSAFDTNESKQYVAGIIRFDNPDYQPAVNDERNARTAKDSAESQYRRDESDCRSAESSLSSAGSSCSSGCSQRDERDRACNRKSSSESVWSSRRSEYDRARSRLDRTPPISEREDIRTATYTVRHHSWRAAWRGQLRSDGVIIPVGGETATSDIETAGAPVAGVPSDPMTFPGNRWFITAIRDQAAAKIAAAANTGLERRSSDLAATCSEPLQWTTEWLECWARARFWGGAPPDGDALVRFLGAAKDRRRGPMWEPLRCLRGA